MEGVESTNMCADVRSESRNVIRKINSTQVQIPGKLKYSHKVFALCCFPPLKIQNPMRLYLLNFQMLLQPHAVVPLSKQL